MAAGGRRGRRNGSEEAKPSLFDDDFFVPTAASRQQAPDADEDFGGLRASQSGVELRGDRGRRRGEGPSPGPPAPDSPSDGGDDDDWLRREAEERQRRQQQQDVAAPRRYADEEDEDEEISEEEDIPGLPDEESGESDDGYRGGGLPNARNESAEEEQAGRRLQAADMGGAMGDAQQRLPTTLIQAQETENARQRLPAPHAQAQETQNARLWQDDFRAEEEDDEELPEDGPSADEQAEMEEVQQAALKIQAQFRGNQARKELEGRQGEPQRQEVQAADVDEELPEDCPSVPDEEEEVEQAAVKIQARFRGKQARREMEEVSRVPAEEVAPDEELAGDEEERAATQIQARFRGSRARKDLERQARRAEEDSGPSAEEGREEEQAALKIQAIYRGGQARKEVATRRGDGSQAEGGAEETQAVEGSARGPLERTMTAEEAAAASEDAPPATSGSTLPRPPPGGPQGPRRRWIGKVPDEKVVLSEPELRRRAQQQLDRTTHRMVLQNIPTMSSYNRGFASLPPLRLEDMPPSVQGTFIRVARYEAEEWLKREKQRLLQFKTQEARFNKQSDKLAAWYEEKCRREEEERAREEQLEREKEEREAQKEQQRRKRNEMLQKRLADWSMEKDRRDREKAEAAERIAQEEEEKRRKREQEYRAKQKASLQQWQKKKEEEEARLLQEAEDRRLREEEEENRLRLEHERLDRSKEVKAAKRRQKAAAAVAAAAARSGNLARPVLAAAVG